MRLYLGAHARCITSEEDLRQPLSAQGRLDVTHVAGFLSLFHQPSPGIIWHSNRLAAIQTAEMIAEAWQVESYQQQKLLNPEGDIQVLHCLLSQWQQDAVLIGHRISLQALLALMLGGMEGSCALPDGGLLCLQRQTNKSWQLQWSLQPELFYRTTD